MFAKKQKDGHIPACEGITRKTLVYGVLKAGSLLPNHRHPEEQTGYLADDHLILTIGDDIFDVRPGDSWAIFGGTEHHAKVISDAVAVEIFSPVRKDYLPQ
jgi:quercetin dioxygenase-like cupin family protein